MENPNPENRNKTALVTGAAQRIGRATAVALAGRGFDVVIHYNRSETEAQALQNEIRSSGIEAWTIKADLSDRDAVAPLFERTVEKAGKIDVLINNASIFPESDIMDFPGTDLDRNIQVNAFAPLQLSRAFAARKGEGVIINFLDTSVTHGDPVHAAYHLSKRVLLQITRMLAKELAPRIRVNAVAPGLILPPPGRDETYLERRKRINPLQRAGTLGDITDAVLYLIDGDFITGQTLFVDGGQHLRGMFPDDQSV